MTQRGNSLSNIQKYKIIQELGTGSFVGGYQQQQPGHFPSQPEQFPPLSYNPQAPEFQQEFSDQQLSTQEYVKKAFQRIQNPSYIPLEPFQIQSRPRHETKMSNQDIRSPKSLTHVNRDINPRYRPQTTVTEDQYGQPMNREQIHQAIQLQDQKNQQILREQNYYNQPPVLKGDPRQQQPNDPVAEITQNYLYKKDRIAKDLYQNEFERDQIIQKQEQIKMRTRPQIDYKDPRDAYLAERRMFYEQNRENQNYNPEFYYEQQQQQYDDEQYYYQQQQQLSRQHQPMNLSKTRSYSPNPYPQVHNNHEMPPQEGRIPQRDKRVDQYHQQMRIYEDPYLQPSFNKKLHELYYKNQQPFDAPPQRQRNYLPKERNLDNYFSNKQQQGIQQKGQMHYQQQIQYPKEVQSYRNENYQQRKML